MYNNRSWLGWTGKLLPGGMKDGETGIKGTFAVENVYGLTGNDVQTGRKECARLPNVNLTAM